MHILFAISVISFFALVLAAVAIAQRVRIRRKLAHPQQDFAQHLFAAAEDQNSRVPHILPHQTVGEISAKKGWNESSDMVTAGLDTHARHSTSLKHF